MVELRMTFKVVGGGSPKIESPPGARRLVMTKVDNDWPGNQFRFRVDCAGAVGAGGLRYQGRQGHPGGAREGPGDPGTWSSNSNYYYNVFYIL